MLKRLQQGKVSLLWSCFGMSFPPTPSPFVSKPVSVWCSGHQSSHSGWLPLKTVCEPSKEYQWYYGGGGGGGAWRRCAKRKTFGNQYEKVCRNVKLLLQTFPSGKLGGRNKFDRIVQLRSRRVRRKKDKLCREKAARWQIWGKIKRLVISKTLGLLRVGVGHRPFPVPTLTQLENVFDM